MARQPAQKSTSIRLDDDLKSLVAAEGEAAGIADAEVIRRAIIFYCATRRAERERGARGGGGGYGGGGLGMGPKLG